MKDKTYKNIGWSFWIKTDSVDDNVELGENIFRTKKEAAYELEEKIKFLEEKGLEVTKKGMTTFKYKSETKERLTLEDKISYNDNSAFALIIKLYNKIFNKRGN